MRYPDVRLLTPLDFPLAYASLDSSEFRDFYLLRTWRERTKRGAIDGVRVEMGGIEWSRARQVSLLVVPHPTDLTTRGYRSPLETARTSLYEFNAS